MVKSKEKYSRSKGGLRFKKGNNSSKITTKRKFLPGKRNNRPKPFQSQKCLSIGPGNTVSTALASENQYNSDSEPDALSELLNCFSNTNQNVSVISDSEEVTDNDDVLMSNSDEEHDPRHNIENKDNSESSLYDENNLEPREATLNVEGDPFEKHIQYDLDDAFYAAVSSIPPNSKEISKKWPVLGSLRIALPVPTIQNSEQKSKFRIDDDTVYAEPGSVPEKIHKVSNLDWNGLFVKTQIQSNILNANRKHVNEYLSEEDQFTPLQRELFSVINNYQDLYYPERNLDNGEEVRFIYCLHAVNHVLKTRLKVVHHNVRLANRQDVKSEMPDEFRDQGLVRPKVLILVPFRNSALRVVSMLSSILLEEDGNNNILNKKRFYEEFSATELAMPKKNPKPEDYERTFKGDTDDNFKIGISVTKKSLKLYADFYSADIIIASALGLRVIVGAEGEANRDFDFLASIELLVLDQAEIVLMQNWDHLLHIWNHLHMQPRESHGTNFARVRPWALSGRARFYRQTLVFCTHILPQISALFTRKCHNFAGKVSVLNPIKAGSICQVVLQLPQVFNKIECSSATESIDARFDYFVTKVLPQYKESLMSHTLIYVPSYFDYVRVRNHFKKELVSFVQICEYSKDAKIARARDMFFHSSAHFLLYSERFHFFRRIRVKGIRHLVFYQPPTFPHFFKEMCNLIQIKDQSEGSLSVSVMYTKYDAAQLAAIVGSDRAAKMLASDKTVHMFMTGD